MSRRRSQDCIESAELVSIGELARLSGHRYSTLKFYTEQGLLPFFQEEQNMTRRFRREKALSRLKEIGALKEAGLSIDAVKAQLACRAK